MKYIISQPTAAVNSRKNYGGENVHFYY